MRRRVRHHRGVLAERLLGLLEDSLGEYAHVDGSVAGRRDHRLARDRGQPDVSAKKGWCREGLGNGEVGEVVSIVSYVEVCGFCSETGIFLLDLYIDLGFEVEVLDDRTFCLLQRTFSQERPQMRWLELKQLS